MRHGSFTVVSDCDFVVGQIHSQCAEDLPILEGFAALAWCSAPFARGVDPPDYVDPFCVEFHTGQFRVKHGMDDAPGFVRVDVNQTGRNIERPIAGTDGVTPAADDADIAFRVKLLILQQIRQTEHGEPAGPFQPFPRECPHDAGREAGIRLHRFGNRITGQRPPLQTPENLIRAQIEFPQRLLLFVTRDGPIDASDVQVFLSLQAVVDQEVRIQIGDQRRSLLAIRETATRACQQTTVIQQTGGYIDVVSDFVSQHFHGKLIDSVVDDLLQIDDDRLIMQPDHGERV